jgi:glycosyltransferase involved in cell wall biosynthesis
MSQMNVIYIAETSLTNKSAYSHHVIKMCDAFSQNDFNLTLILPREKKNLNYNQLKKKFLLTSKKKFMIKSLLGTKTYNFYTRLKFAIRASKFTRYQKPDLIITRSLLSSFCLSILKVYHFLEIHNEIKSISKFLFINLNFINSKYIQRVIFISSALKKRFSLDYKKVLILHDGVDIKNFKIQKKIKKIKVVTYVGSFYSGRGIEIVKHLAKKFKTVKFRLYGGKKNYSKNTENLNFFGHVDYNKVPNILAKSDILLMPYANNVSVRANNLNTADYCSPLKMFDYLASGKIILSSKLDGICEVLNHKKNAIIVNKYTKDNWEQTFLNLLDKKYDLRKIQNNAIKTAKLYTWNQRVSKIIEAKNK